MDEAAAAKSHFGALCASGWHTVAAWMRLRVQYGRREDAERAARGEAIAKLGPSPGFRELKWLKPVYAGDTITYASEIVEKRASQKPARLGHRVRPQHRHQPEGRAGDFVHRLGLRRATARSRMSTAAGSAPASRHAQRGTPRDGRRVRRARAARRLHRPDLRDAADLAGGIRLELRGDRPAARRVRRHHGGLPDSVRTVSASGSARRWCLRRGTALAGLGYCLAPFVGKLSGADRGLLSGRGLGASTQHPLASSLVAHAFSGLRSLSALGTYNFAGDLGKMAVPAAASLLVALLPWRHDAGADRRDRRCAALAILLFTPRYRADAAEDRREQCKPRSVGGTRRLSAAAVDRRDRHRDAHGLAHLPAVPAHRERRVAADHRLRADTGVRRAARSASWSAPGSARASAWSRPSGSPKA